MGGAAAATTCDAGTSISNATASGANQLGLRWGAMPIPTASSRLSTSNWYGSDRIARCIGRDVGHPYCGKPRTVATFLPCPAVRDDRPHTAAWRARPAVESVLPWHDRK